MKLKDWPTQVKPYSKPEKRYHQLLESVMVLLKDHRRVNRYRSAKPVLRPLLREERHGIFANILFPTGAPADGDGPKTRRQA